MYPGDVLGVVTLPALSVGHLLYHATSNEHIYQVWQQPGQADLLGAHLDLEVDRWVWDHCGQGVNVISSHCTARVFNLTILY